MLSSGKARESWTLSISYRHQLSYTANESCEYAINPAMRSAICASAVVNESIGTICSIAYRR